MPAQALTAAEDRHLIEVCRREGRALVTLDVDFANPLIYPPADYPGIAVIRIPKRTTAADLQAGLATFSAVVMSKATMVREKPMWPPFAFCPVENYLPGACSRGSFVINDRLERSDNVLHLLGLSGMETFGDPCLLPCLRRAWKS